MEAILNPWPWYISGPLITSVLVFLILFGKTFGMSSNLSTICTISGAGRYTNFFKFNPKEQYWNLVVGAGAIIGGYIGSHFLSNSNEIILNSTTVQDLHVLGFSNVGASLLPPELYSWEYALRFKGFFILSISGFLVGFGARYAGGCTSGHAIMGLSNLQIPSLIAVIGFFLGGLLMTHFILPLIF